MILTMGSMGETASVAVDELRKTGKNIGLVKLRLWRPFPLEELKAAPEGLQDLDRYGSGRIFRYRQRPRRHGSQIATYNEKERPRVLNFIMGLGGRDVSVEDFIAMAERAEKKKDETYEFYGVRG